MRAIIEKQLIARVPDSFGSAKTIKEFLIGTGGWAYFKVPELNALTAYSRVFNFVEVNSTFYQMPSLRLVERWRKVVPLDFQFSVRTHRSITNRYRLKPVDGAFEALEYMKKICTALRADILHLLLPSSLELGDDSILDMQNLFDSSNLQKLRLAIEARGAARSRLPSHLVQFMQDHGIIHCVDLSKDEEPAYESSILYTRLFGKGEHNVYQPTDEELKQIDEKATEMNVEKIGMSFHFVRMYKDAVRLKTFKETGKFPMITRSKGLASLMDVLREDASFPSTKQELLVEQGWKLFDLDEKTRVRAADLLQKLPDLTYHGLDEIAYSLASFLG
jgi:uncharacterized protein YecE (DUF72 family)